MDKLFLFPTLTTGTLICLLAWDGPLLLTRHALYNQAQTDTLINLLGKVGTIIFKQSKLPKSALDVDSNGKAVPFPAGTRKTFYVWENKSTGISYFLFETGLGENLTTKLIVLKRSEQSGKDWISFLSLDWYKDFKSEPL